MATVTIDVPAKLTIEDGQVIQIDIGGETVWLGETYIPQPEAFTAQIDNGSSLSAAFDFSTSDQRCARPAGIVMPADWTTADLTFQISHDGETFTNMYDDADNEYTVQAGAGRYIAINPADFAGAKAMKVRSGTSGSPVTQGAARLVTIQAIR